VLRRAELGKEIEEEERSPVACRLQERKALSRKEGKASSSYYEA